MINILRIAATLACFATFLGIMWWAYSARNKSGFDEAARIPFDQD